LSYKLDKLLSDPDRFKTMQANSQRMGHPNAAKEIVGQLLSA
jgi:UDP-N-acetylglucosamine:LPS N-acetylglucosamine transferase